MRRKGGVHEEHVSRLLVLLYNEVLLVIIPASVIVLCGKKPLGGKQLSNQISYAPSATLGRIL